MAVVIETTLGDITVDLYLDQRPVTCLNFLKLCKMKYYNFNLFHTIRNGFIAQTGDPTGEGSGGQSIWGILEGPEKRFFSGEKMPKIRHTDAGLLSMVCTDDMMVGSQFFLTLAPDLDSLDGTHCVIGEVTEGREVLTKINEVICDENHRPYRDVRITHTVVLEDPFSDPVGLRAPSRSPSPNPERLKGGRIAPDEEIDEMQGRSVEEIQEMIEEKEAKARATILEIVGDLPDAEIAPPENVLFVCKLNPVTTDEDLEIIFSRFGTIVSCEVIKDKKTGNSLQYAFIEFDNKKSCEDAYFKMDNVLIDDRRIHVDFSQSVSKMRWLGKGRGVQYFDNDSKQVEEKQDNKDKRRYRNESRKNNHNRRDERDNKQEPDGDIEQRRNRDKEQKHEKDREHRHDRDREHKHDRDREHRYVRERYPNHDRGHRAKEQRHNREEEQNRDREQRQYRDKEKRYDRERGNVKERSRSRSRLNESQKNRQESDTERGNVRKNGNTYNAYKSRSDKLKHSPIRNNKHDFTTSRSQNEESECKDRAEKYENNHKNKYSHKKQKDDLIRYSKHTEQHNYYKHKESQKQTKRSGQQNDEPLTPSPTLKRKNNKLSIKKIETKSSKKVNKSNNRNKKSRTTTSTSDSSSSTSSSDSSSSSESDRRKKKLRRRRKYSTSSSSTESSSSSSSYSSSSSSSSDSEHKKKKLKNKKKNCKNK